MNNHLLDLRKKLLALEKENARLRDKAWAAAGPLPITMLPALREFVRTGFYPAQPDSNEGVL